MSQQGTDPQQRPAAFALAGTGALLVLLWLGVIWGDAPALCSARRAAGLVLVFFWPAALVLWGRVRGDSPFRFFWLAVACNIIGQCAVLAAVTACGGRWSERGFAAAQTLIAAAAAFAFVARPGRQDMGAWWSSVKEQSGRLFGGVFFIVLVVHLTFKPRGFDEDRYWPLETERPLREAEQTASREDVQIRHGEGWREVGPSAYAIGSRSAKAAIESRVPSEVPVHVVLLVEAHREGRVDLLIDGRVVASEYAHPRFDPGKHPRNYPPPNFVLACKTALTPGEHELELRIDDSHAERGDGRLIVTDLTSIRSGKGRRAAFEGRYLMANVGDTRENLELARSLLRYPFPVETSYAGEIFDGGGYAISNLPFPYYPYALALLACGNEVMSLGWLHVALLIGIWWLVRLCALSGLGERGVMGNGGEALCVVTVLSYALLMRFMVESLYVHTVLTLVFLVAVQCLPRGRWGLFLTFGAFVVLTKGGLVLMALLLVAAAVVRARPARDLVRIVPLFAGECALLAGAVLAFGWATGSLDAWQEDLFGDDYVERFSYLAQAIRGDVAAWRVLAASSWELTKHVLAAGGVLVAFFLLRPDRQGLLMVGVGGLFHLLVCASDPEWQSWGHKVHPLNYFTPAAALLAAAGLRSLTGIADRKWAKWAGLAMLAPVAAGMFYCHGRAQTYRLSPAMEPAWGSMHAACVNDYLLRRAAQRLGSGDHAGVAHDAGVVLWECDRHAADHRLTYQKAKAHYLAAHCASARGDADAVRMHLDAMRSAGPRFEAAYRQSIERLIPRKSGSGE